MQKYVILFSAKKRKKRRKLPSSKSSLSSTSSRGKFSTDYLENILDRLKNQQHCDSTKENYYAAWTNFNKFIITLDRIPKKWEHKLNLYCAYLIEIVQLKSSTVRSYVSGIKAVLIRDGYKWDQDLFVMSMFTKICKRKDDCVQTRMPIRKELLDILLFELERMFQKCNYIKAMYQAAFAMAYYGMMRVGELTAGPHVLKAKDLHEARNGRAMLAILYTSKTHTRRDRPQKIEIKGATKDYSIQDMGFYCPVKLIKEYTELRPKYNTDTEPLFILPDRTPLTAKLFRSTLKNILRKTGLDSQNYDTHSFRIGRATDMRKLKFSINYIKEKGRWRSNAVYKYIR